MVVPRDQPRALRVHGLQAFFTSVQGVSVAVVRQAVHPAARGQSNSIGGSRIFINVITQEQHHV